MRTFSRRPSVVTYVTASPPPSLPAVGHRLVTSFRRLFIHLCVVVVVAEKTKIAVGVQSTVALRCFLRCAPSGRGNDQTTTFFCRRLVDGWAI